MKSLKYICAVLFLLAGMPDIQGQTTDMGPVPFVNIVANARSAGMGGASTAVSADAYSIYNNPSANLFGANRGEAAYSYLPWMSDVNDGNKMHSFAGFFKIDNKQSMSVGYRHFTGNKIDIIDNSGNSGGSFTPAEWSLNLGYSRKIIDKMAVSLAIGYISSDLGTFDDAEKATALSFNIGMLYTNDLCWVEGGSWSLGLNLTDIGSKIQYLEEKYALPTVIKLGGAVVLPFSEDHTLECALDLGMQLSPSDASDIMANLGAEYFFLKHGFLRAGYRFIGRSSGDENFASVGCGVKVGPVKGDFSYWLADSDSPLKNTFCLTVGISFGK